MPLNRRLVFADKKVAISALCFIFQAKFFCLSDREKGSVLLTI